jgi:hypothetical protein
MILESTTARRRNECDLAQTCLFEKKKEKILNEKRNRLIVCERIVRREWQRRFQNQQPLAVETSAILRKPIEQMVKK